MQEPYISGQPVIPPVPQRGLTVVAVLDYENSGQRLRELAARLDRTEAAVRWWAWCLRAAQFAGDVA